MRPRLAKRCRHGCPPGSIEVLLHEKRSGASGRLRLCGADKYKRRPDDQNQDAKKTDRIFSTLAHTSLCVLRCRKGGILQNQVVCECQPFRHFLLYLAPVAKSDLRARWFT